MFKNPLSIGLLISGLISTGAHAHEVDNTLPVSSVVAKAALSYRNESKVAPGEAWLVPGIHLGGDALPTEQGLSLGDGQVLGHYRVQEDYAVSAKLSAHGHTETLALELENFWFTWSGERVVDGLLVELGLLRTDITDTAYYHASESDFGEAPLLSDAFFGRHFNDRGLKVKWQPSWFGLGAELWSGSGWPAEGNEGGASTWINIELAANAFALNATAWALSMDALNRSDGRYSDGHSHGGLNAQSPAANIFFTGTTDGFGANIRARYQADTWQVFTEVEWIQFEQAGDLRDEGSQGSAIESVYSGSRALLGLAIGDHKLTVQAETLTLENTFFDAVNLLFLEQSGLLNNGFEPRKLMASWQWAFARDFTLRGEWIVDESRDGNKVDYFGLGVVWSWALSLDRE